ncbi:BnaCnng26360D [Brassica napus]|uniref:BnaCnng26360D protein n=1 Tax=Brassica napus TaxID=3708 RepID=A0A078IXW5_BRANA|nr:BnaCnng26360D [Brassica napus]
MQSSLQDRETPKTLLFDGGGSRDLVERRRDPRCGGEERSRLLGLKKTGSGFLIFRSPGNLHGGGAWLRSLVSGSRGLRASGFTMKELSTGVVGSVGNVWPPHFFKPLLGTPNPQLPSRSDFQSGLYDRFLAMNRGNDLRCGPGLI